MDTNSIWIDEPAAKLVADFHLAFGHPIAELPITEAVLHSDLGDLRFNLIKEEFKELTVAWSAGNVIDVIDALQDLKYVIYGAELAMGIATEEHFAEVHAANMRKLGPDGKPIYREDGKVLKPEGWTGPDHDALLLEVEERGAVYC